MTIQQWNVLVDSGRRMTFENEALAFSAAFETATHVTPAVVQLPNGDEFVVLKRDYRWSVHVSKVL